MNTISTAPWWYVAVLAGGFTILGGLITLIGGWLSDRRKLSREDRRQWDKEIRELASTALIECEKLSAIRYHMGIDENGDYRAPNSGQYKEWEVNRALDSLTEHLTLLTDGAAVPALHAMREAANAIGIQIYQYEDRPQGEQEAAGTTWARLRADFLVARTAFIKAVRRDIRLDK